MLLKKKSTAVPTSVISAAKKAITFNIVLMRRFGVAIIAIKNLQAKEDARCTKICIATTDRVIINVTLKPKVAAT